MSEEIGKHKGAVETLLHEQKELSRILQIVNSQLERHVKALEDAGVDTDQFIKKFQEKSQRKQKDRRQSQQQQEGSRKNQKSQRKQSRNKKSRNQQDRSNRNSNSQSKQDDEKDMEDYFEDDDDSETRDFSPR